MVNFDDSKYMRGKVGLFEQDEFGRYEEELTFNNIKAAEDYVSNLQKSLRKYKKKRCGGKK